MKQQRKYREPKDTVWGKCLSGFIAVVFAVSTLTIIPIASAALGSSTDSELMQEAEKEKKEKSSGQEDSAKVIEKAEITTSRSRTRRTSSRSKTKVKRILLRDSRRGFRQVPQPITLFSRNLKLSSPRTASNSNRRTIHTHGLPKTGTTSYGSTPENTIAMFLSTARKSRVSNTTSPPLLSLL